MATDGVASNCSKATVSEGEAGYCTVGKQNKQVAGRKNGIQPFNELEECNQREAQAGVTANGHRGTGMMAY